MIANMKQMFLLLLFTQFTLKKCIFLEWMDRVCMCVCVYECVHIRNNEGIQKT